MKIDDIISTLSMWQGSYVRWWRYAVSHQQLILRLEKPETATIAELGLINCDYISGPTSWKNGNLEVLLTVEHDECTYLVRDKNVDFTVSCHVLTIIERESEF